MFPWECDDSGEEATPTWCLTGTFEHHITADVGIAFWNYYRVTRDKEWLRREGYPVLKMIADFWVSRAVKNPDGTYSINNVVGANEYAANINDNTFTNGSAKVVLRDAVAAARAVGEKPDPMWSEVSDNIKFHYMPDGTIKENATYNGEAIKQADANLLAYPLGVVTDPKRVRQDLEYYSQKIDKNGPAMGNAILAILYAQLGDSEKAYEYFSRSYIPHKRPPFGVLSENGRRQQPLLLHRRRRAAPGRALRFRRIEGYRRRDSAAEVRAALQVEIPYAQRYRAGQENLHLQGRNKVTSGRKGGPTVLQTLNTGRVRNAPLPVKRFQPPLGAKKKYVP